MPITIKVAEHDAKPIASNTIARSATKADDILATLRHEVPNQPPTRGQLLQSSFDQDKMPAHILPRCNGLWDAITEAYNQHHHLIVRPEDIWLAVLTQFSFYVNAHAEELRGSFVAHEGKKELEIVYEFGDRFTINYEHFATTMTTLMHQNVADLELRNWILPAFSTTTSNDLVVASIVMMGTLKAYFDYKFTVMCGIPTVTLLGDKGDYEDIFLRLEKLADYGEEPKRLSSLLKPVLWHIVRSFDEPEDDTTKHFWQRILKWNTGNMSGGDYWTGWATTFNFWNAEGERLAKFPGDRGWETEYDASDGEGEGDSDIMSRTDAALPDDPMSLPTTKEFGRLGISQASVGFISVPVKVDDNGHEFDAEMLAGSVGFTCSGSGQQNVAEDESGQEKKGIDAEMDTLQPCSGWFMYERNAPEGAVAACTIDEYLQRLRSRTANQA